MPIIFIGCLTFTTIMALIPSAEAPNPFNLLDKTQHALAFVVLTFTGSFSYQQKIKVIYIGLVLYGATIEILQSTLTTTRVGEASDFLADSIGILIGLILYLVTKKLFKT